jgi:hypothetical protein
MEVAWGTSRQAASPGDGAGPPKHGSSAGGGEGPSSSSQSRAHTQGSGVGASSTRGAAQALGQASVTGSGRSAPPTAKDGNGGGGGERGGSDDSQTTSSINTELLNPAGSAPGADHPAWETFVDEGALGTARGVGVSGGGQKASGGGKGASQGSAGKALVRTYVMPVRAFLREIGFVPCCGRVGQTNDGLGRCVARGMGSRRRLSRGSRRAT